MPKAKARKPAQPVAPTPPAAPVETQVISDGKADYNPDNLPVLYDKLEIVEYSTTSEKGPLTIARQKKLMGWETEKEWQVRMVEEEKRKGNSSAKPTDFTFGDGVRRKNGKIQPVHCKNLAGEKVICWCNANNRPFDEKWAEDLTHTCLYGQWVGPFTVPGGTVNGETIRISRYGRVLSGQHQMTGCILGGEELEKARRDGVDTPTSPKYPIWAKYGIGQAPFLETIVVTGMSEDPRILQSVDYVKPRTAADVFYTSDVFKASTPPERKELCRMLAIAVDLFWTRTAAKGYRTHPEVVGLLERHGKLLDCVLHLFDENRASAHRKISALHLSAGQCAALMMLMAGSKTTEADSDAYRNMEPPTQQGINLGLWQKAEEFWTLLANGMDFLQVRTALGRLIGSSLSNDDNQGLGGTSPEKLALLASAWERWRDHTGNGSVFDNADLEDGGLLTLAYNDLDDKGKKLPLLPDGRQKLRLINLADFGGIDCPESVGSAKRAAREEPPSGPSPSEEEVKRAIEEASDRRAGRK